MALLNLIENITTSIDDHEHAVGVFIDTSGQLRPEGGKLSVLLTFSYVKVK